jgi:hypothetical protein
MHLPFARSRERLVARKLVNGFGDSLSGEVDEDAGGRPGLAWAESRWSIGLTVSTDAVAGQLNW